MHFTHRLGLSILVAASICAVAIPAQADDSALNTVNPQGLTFSNVSVPRPKFDEPFARTGRRVPVTQIAQVSEGSTAEQVRSWLGEPVSEAQESRSKLWDYNLELRMDDDNFIVCQYKVVFAPDTQQVRETTWRRPQCADTFAADLKQAQQHGAE